MTAVRRIIEIDEEKCDGCGQCVPDCPEGALRIVDGKARLVADRYCDGLGACLGSCPRDAIKIVEREAEAFDQEAAEARAEPPEQHPAGCPGLSLQHFEPDKSAEPSRDTMSALGQWPVQLALVPAEAPLLRGADVLLAADCVGFAMRDFHSALLDGRRLLVACPKLDETAPYVEKLTAVLEGTGIRSLTVAHMEVPCCHGLTAIVRQALKRSGADLPVQEVTVSIRGRMKQSRPLAAEDAVRAPAPCPSPKSVQSSS